MNDEGTKGQSDNGTKGANIAFYPSSLSPFVTLSPTASTLYITAPPAYHPRVSLRTVAIIVLSKFPEAGKVKTRLAPELSPEQAADVHQAFLLHLLRRVHRLSPAQLILCVDPPDAVGRMRDLIEADCHAMVIPQATGDLGERLSAAADAAFLHHEHALLLGSDSPDLPATALRKACDLTAEAQVVVGPAEDGGFWCLGLRRSVDSRKLLERIDWSSGRETRQLLENADRLGYRVQLTAAWDDVDRPADLQRLLTRLSASSDDEDRALLSQLCNLIPDRAAVAVG